MASLRFLKGRLTIQEYSLEDPVVVSFLKGKEEAERELWLGRALRLGCVALQDERLLVLISKIEKELGVELLELKQRVLLEEQLAAPIRGAQFETEYLMTHVDRLARTTDDVAELVGTKEGNLIGSKKGDILVTVNPLETGGIKRTIIFEAKTQKDMSIKGKGGVLKELEEAKSNRNADAAVIVFDVASVPKEIGSFRRYPPFGVACSVDPARNDVLPLEVAYKLARAEVILQLERKEPGVTPSTVRRFMNEAELQVRAIQNIRNQVSSSISKMQDVSSALVDLENNLTDILNRMDAAMSRVHARKRK